MKNQPVMEQMVSILIPVYNERETVEAVLERVRTAPLPETMEREIVVVDDGSTDGTTGALARFEGREPYRIVYSRANAGKGAALRKAIAEARGEIVLIQDADLEYDPGDFRRLLEPMVAGEVRVVYGTRFAQGRPAGMRHLQWLANRMLRGAANLLYGSQLSDEATAYKVFDAKLLRELSLTYERFEFCPEVTAKILKRGITICEVPVRYRGRSAAEGKKIRWHDGVKALWVLMKFRFVG